jgi:hypothetical protein
MSRDARIAWTVYGCIGAISAIAAAPFVSTRKEGELDKECGKAGRWLAYAGSVLGIVLVGLALAAVGWASALHGRVRAAGAHPAGSGRWLFSALVGFQLAALLIGAVAVVVAGCCGCGLCPSATVWVIACSVVVMATLFTTGSSDNVANAFDDVEQMLDWLAANATTNSTCVGGGRDEQCSALRNAFALAQSLPFATAMFFGLASPC